MPTVIDNPLVDWPQNWRTVRLALLYAVVIAASFYLAYEIRFEFVVPDSYQQERLRMIGIVVGVKLVALVVARQLGSAAYLLVHDGRAAFIVSRRIFASSQHPRVST